MAWLLQFIEDLQRSMSLVAAPKTGQSQERSDMWQRFTQGLADTRPKLADMFDDVLYGPEKMQKSETESSEQKWKQLQALPALLVFRCRGVR